MHKDNMKGQSSYVPPTYVPLGQSDQDVEVVTPKADPSTEPLISEYAEHSASASPRDALESWSSGICACFDDMQSCCIGLLCPCYLFGKNAKALGSTTLMGSCTTHFLLWTLVNTVCCVLSEGVILGLPGCFVACYACGYRRTLRSKYNLPEAPCGDFFTHFFCHLCAVCQEYREIRERSGRVSFSDLDLAELSAPPLQTMESDFPE